MEKEGKKNFFIEIPIFRYILYEQGRENTEKQKFAEQILAPTTVNLLYKGCAYSLFDRAKTVFPDEIQLQEEFKNILLDLKHNSYTSKFVNIWKNMHLTSTQLIEEKSATYILIPYIHKVSNIIKRIAQNDKVRTAIRIQIP